MFKIFNKIKSLFIKNSADEDKAQQNNIKKKTSVIYKNKNRFLKIGENDCGLILHEDNQVEVIFTKYYENKQEITSNEELLMALTIYLKQPGFGEMLISEFHRIAEKNTRIFEENTSTKKE